MAAVTETVPGAEQAGVSLREGRILRTVAATGDLARRLNAIEHELDEGPCMQAALQRSGKNFVGGLLVSIANNLARSSVSAADSNR